MTFFDEDVILFGGEHLIDDLLLTIFYLVFWLVYIFGVGVMFKRIYLFVLFFVCFCGFGFGGIVIVDPNGFGDFSTIQGAIDDVGTVDGDVVIVMPGRYVENINLSGKAITLSSSDPLDGNIVLGTIIDGNYLGSAITCDNGEGFDTVIDGFLITKGYGTYDGALDEYFGGGLYNKDSSPTVSNCTFSMNWAVQGGGMYNTDYSSPTVSNCTFSGNMAGQGGGMFNENSSPTISNTMFSMNQSDEHGGGMINLLNSSPMLSNCMFEGNTAAAFGGGIFNLKSSWPMVSNCTFKGNTAALGGGGMFSGNDLSVVSDSCFCINTPDQIYMNMYIDDGGNVVNDDYCPPPRVVIEGDVDSDGDVDMGDLAVLAGNWLAGV